MEGKHYDKIIGNNPVQEEFDDLRLNKGAEKIEGLELEKSKREMMILDFAENALDEYLDEFEKERKTKIPRENIHVIKEGKIGDYDSNLAGSAGLANTFTSSILLERRTNEADFALVAFHEMVHIKSFVSYQFCSKENLNKARRIGMGSLSFDNDENGDIRVTEYLKDLDEALTSFMERRFFLEHVDSSDLFSDEDKDLITEFSYEDEYSSVMRVVDSIVDASEEPVTKEQVIRLMMDAKFNGRMLPLARLIKNSLGVDALSNLFEKDKRVL